jgi:hypothetical protein
MKHNDPSQDSKAPKEFPSLRQASINCSTKESLSSPLLRCVGKNELELVKSCIAIRVMTFLPCFHSSSKLRIADAILAICYVLIVPGQEELNDLSVDVVML